LIWCGPDLCFAQPVDLDKYRLIWRDEFDGSKLDPRKWSLRSPGRRGDAINDAAAISLDGKGCLLLRAGIQNGLLVSAMIHTEGLFSFRYGYFECRAKLNRVPGLWSAFWLQSSGNQTGGTPERNGAEIDIFEYFPHVRSDAVSHAIHWGGYGTSHRVQGPVYSLLKPSTDGFHVFGLLWTHEGYTIFVDGEKTQESNLLVAHVKEFIVLSLEANTRVSGMVNTHELPDYFVVDYVRVFQK
jgi:beta-glucanase (GH16 family)